MSPTPIYQKLARYIDSRMISRKLVAINSGISESKLSLLLSGRRRLTVDECNAICKAIDADPRMFFGEDASLP